MIDTPSFKEDHISQIPALQLLIKMGYTYLTPEEALEERRGKISNVVLENILEKQLRELNEITYKGEKYQFSNRNFTGAVEALKDVLDEGLIHTNENIYDLLSLGKSFEETLQGNTRSYSMGYIDWKTPENNVFHVTEEFEVERTGGREHRRPDIILFVNGIPWGVIECKKPEMKKPIKQAIQQQIRNQRQENVPRLFWYAQALMAISKNNAEYATVGTPRKFWSVWKEREDIEDELAALVNKPISNEIKDKLFSTRFNYVRRYFDAKEETDELVTEQDRAIYSIFRPDRFIELVHKFIVFDLGKKKIARYNQYYATKNTLERVKTFDSSRQRKGGVIWHTQGTGKSILMVMIAKSLVIDPEIDNPRVVLVTDRIDLDDQIYRTFKHCGKEPVMAKTGANLLDLLETGKHSVITTVVDKFDAAVAKRKISIEDENVFVLVDESHRSQYGVSHAMMRRVLPNACYIGFTGTPLTKGEKSTLKKFGDFIDIYTIDEAVEDKVVVPLLYEGRLVEQEISKHVIDTWFERETRGLSDAQKVDLKRKFSRLDKLNHTEQRMYLVAYDISQHFDKNWKDTGYKAQLATDRKKIAIKYKEFFEEIGLVTSEVVISAPDAREGYDEVDGEPEEAQKFWEEMVKGRFGNEKEYNRQIINAFDGPDDPEILIVVDKLLTGFDCTRNTILYIDKNLKEHNLLQAIARVNRVHEGKDFGFIIDYRGLLVELDSAMMTYRRLVEDGFDPNDLAGTLTDVIEEIEKLPQKHSELWDIFKEIRNRLDEEEYEQLLADEEVREQFYDKVSVYSKSLGVALSSTRFYEACSEEQIKKYKEDLRFFQKLRSSVKIRYADAIDHKEYEPKIQKLLDRHVVSTDIQQITDLVNIFDRENFEKELTKIKGKAARADTIAHRTKRSIDEKFAEDPVFYKKFSVLIIKTIDDYRAQRLSEADYLTEITEVMEAVRDRKDKDVPWALKNKEVAKAFFGIIDEVMGTDEKELTAKLSIGVDDIILKNRIVDWQMKGDIINQMKNEIEDYLHDNSEPQLSYDQIDIIMDQVLKVAKIRYAQ